MTASDEAPTNKLYDACAAHYGDDLDDTVAARRVMELLEKHMPVNADVLDVGCANGIHLRRVAPLCRTIAGVDISEQMIEVAQHALEAGNVSNARLLKASAADLEFPNESFDLVYSFATLLLVPDLARALNEIARVLRPGGVAILDMTGRYNISRIYWHLYYRRLGHFGIHAMSYPRLVRELAARGLDVIEREAFGFTDQWRYVPGLHKLKGLGAYFHRRRGDVDLDYLLSNHPWCFSMANRWYLVCRKMG